MLLDPARFTGHLDGRRVGLTILRNDDGMSVGISNVGGKILQVVAPDRYGRPGDVALGFDSLQEVLTGSPSLGAFVAPYAGRIAQARFTLDARRYDLPNDDGPHSLHGGPGGSCLRVFDIVEHDPRSLVLRAILPAEQTGYPGTLALELCYRLVGPDCLAIDYLATCDGPPTPASFTSHAYFNLDRADARTIDEHWLQVFADEHLTIGADQTVDGTRAPVGQGAPDLRRPRSLATLAGLDHVYVLRPDPTGGARPCARLGCERSGRILETISSEPVLVVYGGEHLSAPHRPRQGICLEPQRFPNAPNCPALPLNLVSAEHPYRGTIRYRFTAA
ncbi:MAG: aldose epimerase family protein [Burkholderiaceae bacterium]